MYGLKTTKSIIQVNIHHHLIQLCKIEIQGHIIQSKPCTQWQYQDRLNIKKQRHESMQNQLYKYIFVVPS